MTYSTTTYNKLDIDLQPQPRPQGKLKRQHKAKQTVLNAWAASSSLSKDLNVTEGVQSITQTQQTITIYNQTPPKSIVELEERVKASNPPRLQSPTQKAAKKMPAPKQKGSPRPRRDQKANPSPASGGIPDPTSDYLRACMFGPTSLRQPQHLLVVIDLNGTLLFRPSKKRPTKFNMRPHAQTFLRYCVNTFTVVIWSSARAENVNAMCNTILTPDIRSRVAAIWGRDKFGLTKADFELRVQCYKRLSKIWQDPKIVGSHPASHEGLRWDQTNTVLIDDSREKARTEPHNLIEVPEWLGDLHERDDILPQVHDYLNHLSMHSNVSACLHSHPWKPTVF